MGTADELKTRGRTSTHPGAVLKERFRIEGSLGRGRLAATFSAFDLSTSRPCVVKELSVRNIGREPRLDALSSGEQQKIVQLFEREARTLANLEHVGIPRFIDYFTVSEEDDLRLYLVQELIAGSNVAELVRSGRNFAEREVLKLGMDVARILAYLHGLPDPLVHRDVKPENLVLRDDASVSLVDFGAVNHWLKEPEEGGSTIIGTLGYMPIEQYEGKAVPASDVFSLGMTLLTVLTHQEPNDLARSGMRTRIDRHANVTKAFASVLEKMTQTSWRDRYQSATEVVDDLHAVFEGRDPTRGRRNRRLMIASGIAFAVLVPGVVALRARPRASRPAGASSVPTVFVPTSREVRARALETVATVDELNEMVRGGYLAGLSTLKLGSHGVWSAQDTNHAWQTLLRSSDLDDLKSLTIEGRSNGTGRGMPSGLPSALPRLVSLTTLAFRGNSVGNTGAKALAEMTTATSVTSLVLSHEEIGTAGFAALLGSQAFPQLQSLTLSLNQIGVAVAPDVPRTRSLPSLLALDLSRNGVGDPFVAALASTSVLSGLASLNLSSNKIGSSGARSLAQSPALESLDTLNLSGNAIGDDGARAIAESTSLLVRSLGLGGTGIGDKGARALARSKGLGMLFWLDLSSNSLGESAKVELQARFGNKVRF